MLTGENQPPKDGGQTSEAGTKRQQPDYPSGPSTLRTSGNSGANIHLVYVRRKFETEPGKINTHNNVDSGNSPGSRKYNNGGMIQLKEQQKDIQTVQTQEPETTVPEVFAPIPADSLTTSIEELSHADPIGETLAGLPAAEPNSTVTNGVPSQGDQWRSSNQDWKERFIRLQIFSRHCDQSDQEDYIQKLGCLTAAGRSRHAVELEKRAILLALQEGKELQRMKHLNVFGKASPNINSLPVSRTLSPSQAQFQRESRTRGTLPGFSSQ